MPSFHDIDNRLPGNVELLRKCVVGPVAGCVQTSDLPDLCFGEARARMLFSMPLPDTVWTSRQLADSLVAFCDAVSHIVGVSSKEEVIGADAVADIAAMADDQSFRDLTVGQLPRKAVSTYLFLQDAKSSVAIGESTSSPEPAFVCIRPINLFPESSLEAHTLMLPSFVIQQKASTGGEP